MRRSLPGPAAETDGPHTENDYRRRLGRHLLPFLGEYGLDEIESALCRAFKAHKLREATEVRAAIAAATQHEDVGCESRRPSLPARSSSWTSLSL